ncbi:serine hydrolase domain-containing protein [Piscinibacter sakaiensis]|uniref:serine hydrolase domain-containing protein n=1 Tax=Piscinibacter sakaiensis TaxID=1547922 RepID=UPI003729A60F
MASPTAPAGSPPVAEFAAFERRLRERIGRDLVGVVAVQVGPWGRRVHRLGWRRAAERSPMEEDTVLELGSLTKPFVALALADGVLAGRWRLEDPAEDGLPDGLRLRDSTGAPLRLIDLATHRSGLPRMPANLLPRELAAPYSGYSPARLWDFVRQWVPTVPRDTRFEYSNLGYGLLSLVLARRDGGRSLDALLAQRVFAPLGEGLQLRRPGYAGDDPARVLDALRQSMQAGRSDAVGHDADGRAVPRWEFDALAGAVGLVGPIAPVARFMEAALGLFPHPLGPAFALCLQTSVPGETPLHPFGLAWEQAMLPGPGATRRLHNQDGATGGFSSSVWLEPERRRGVAVVANSFAETRELALAGLDPSIGPADFGVLYLPPEQLRPYVGRYRTARGERLELLLQGRRLWVREPSGAGLELVPQTPMRFFARDRQLGVVFEELPPRGLRLQADGRAPGLRFLREP